MTPVQRGRRSTPGTVRCGRLAVLVAPAGLGAGHLLAYALSGADAEAHLAATGHGYLPTALRVAVAMGLLGAVAAVLGGTRRATGRGGSLALLPTAVRLIGIQTGAFVLLEVAERLVAGAPLADLWPLLGVGLLVQVLVAALLAPLLVGLERVGELLVFIRRSAGPRPTHRLPTRSTERMPPVEARPWSERAPPAPLLA